MLILITGLILFLGVHFVPMYLPLRGKLIDLLGGGIYKPYRIITAIVAAIGLIMMIWGYGIARENSVAIYNQPFVPLDLTYLLMLPVFILAAATYFPGYIRKTLRHPLLISIGLLALAHLLISNTPESLILFGSLLIWPVMQIISLTQKGKSAPVSLKGSRPWINDIIATAIGGGVYSMFIWLGHEWLIGKAISW